VIQLRGVLTADQVATVRRILDASNWLDGRTTAGQVAAKVKNNLELDPKAEHRDKLIEACMGALYAQPKFLAYAHPSRVSTPIFARYRPGMTYGDHVDDPVMGGQEGSPRYRSDLSMTLFLSNAADCEGGELVIQTAFGEQRVKLDAGDVVIYPSASVHRVEPLISGERVVMLTWMQSLIRDASQRELLYGLWQAREDLLAKDPEAAASKQVEISYANLLRMWADT
jgi:PKHD-type hydroxylase